MKVVVTGATGNFGTSTVEALKQEPSVDAIVGVARRRPEQPDDRVEYHPADVRHSPLRPLVAGADAVVHLAWAFQPQHEPDVTWDVNVHGTERLLQAVAEAGVPNLVVASSVGAYSPNTSSQRIDESWPTNGWSAAAYCREKAYNERMLDVFERDHPEIRVVRVRPAFLFKAPASLEQTRIFAGHLVPARLIGRARMPVMPGVSGLRFQAMHADDAADAVVRALTSDVRGPFNLAADPVIDTARLAEVFGGRPVELPRALARAGLTAAWAARLVPTDPDLFDYLMQIPLMSADRARSELGWSPSRTSIDALHDLKRGLAEDSGYPTPPLHA